MVPECDSKGEAKAKENSEDKTKDLAESSDVKDQTFGTKADKENRVLSSSKTKSTSRSDSVSNDDSGKTAETAAQAKKESVRRSTRTKRRPA